MIPSISAPLRRHIGHVSFMVGMALIVMGVWGWRDPPLLEACLGGAFALIFLADLILPFRPSPRFRR